LFSQTELDTISAQKAIIAFTDYANYCQTDSLSPIFLIKTAQVARAINNIPQAKVVLDKCIADYPNFKSRPAALFLLAQLYDDNNYMNDENEAKRLYQKIIDEYPHSDWTMSAKGAIEFIGKSDIEITNMLLKRKK
jgi:outer membrane protein assembly factor BamD (BamD/ComL family)